jgi:ribosomal protein S18 acetylase RimI-like enzyme
LGKELFCYIAEINGLIVSHIFLLITQKLPKIGRPNASYARISTVRTIPRYRNQGIGSMLMDYVKKYCIEKNVEELVVFGPTEESISFYEKAGFKKENEVMEINFD